MRNFIERIKSYLTRKDCADMAICTWKSANEEVYADFCKRMDAIDKGDLSILMDIYQMIWECTPPEALLLYNWLSDFMNGKDIQNIANQQWAGKYTDIIAQCITNKRLWIGVNVKTGTVELLTSPKSELLMAHSETPIEVWNRLPQETRSYLTGQLDVLMKNSKGCYLLSKLERKMVYQSLTYISRIIFLSHAVFVGEVMANLYDYVVEKKEILAYCMYYFVIFDHGLSRMAKLLDRLLNSGEVDNGDMILIKSCVALLVHQSIEMGTESKAGWEDTAEACNPEKERIKQGIRSFLEENTEDISLAYLLKSLVKAGRIKASIKYMTFHRAIEQFYQRHYGHDIPQKRYGEIKDITLTSPQRGNSYIKAKRIIDRWTDYFIKNV